MAIERNTFNLAPELKRDTEQLTSINGHSLSLCYMGIMNDKRYPWLILVPQKNNLTEIIDLTASDRHQLMDEITLVSEQMKSLFTPYKLNIGAIGNLVPQLHIHIIARQKTDHAWPNPVWGIGETQNYSELELQNLIAHIK